VAQVGLHGVLADGDGVEVARVAGRDVADLDLGARPAAEAVRASSAIRIARLGNLRFMRFSF
jgi:hypothetical protein